jgi:GMP synthase (glutamine-hydrolysing)
MRGYIRARSEALASEDRCGKRLAREVSAAPQARQVLRRFVRHARGSRTG